MLYLEAGQGTEEDSMAKHVPGDVATNILDFAIMRGRLQHCKKRLKTLVWVMESLLERLATPSTASSPPVESTQPITKTRERS